MSVKMIKQTLSYPEFVKQYPWADHALRATFGPGAGPDGVLVSPCEDRDKVEVFWYVDQDATGRVRNRHVEGFATVHYEGPGFIGVTKMFEPKEVQWFFEEGDGALDIVYAMRTAWRALASEPAKLTLDELTVPRDMLVSLWWIGYNVISNPGCLDHMDRPEPDRTKDEYLAELGKHVMGAHKLLDNDTEET